MNIDFLAQVKALQKTIPPGQPLQDEDLDLIFRPEDDFSEALRAGQGNRVRTLVDRYDGEAASSDRSSAPHSPCTGALRLPTSYSVKRRATMQSSMLEFAVLGGATSALIGALFDVRADGAGFASLRQQLNTLPRSPDALWAKIAEKVIGPEPAHVRCLSTPTAQRPAAYADYLALRQENMRCLSDERSLRTLARYNTEIAPHLQVEEAALQSLAQQLVYADMPRNAKIRFNVRQTLGHILDDRIQVPGRIASEYKVEGRTLDVPFAYLLSPCSEGSNDADWIVVFRGTTPGVRDIKFDRDHQQTGECADYRDPHGVGYQAFAAAEKIFGKWLRHVERQGRRVLITGHSLGGVLAARLAAVAPAVDRTLLVTFEAPGLDIETRDNMRRRGFPSQHVRMLWHRHDPVPLAGQAHPDGLGYEISNAVEESGFIDAVHNRPFLVDWALKGTPLRLRQAGPRNDYCQVPVEALRRFGAVALEYLFNTLVPVMAPGVNL